MPAISAADFAAPRSPSIHHVPLPECGLDAYAALRELGARDLQALRLAHGREADTEDMEFVWELLARGLCDDSGTLLFADAAECREAFGLSLKTLQRLAEEVLKFSGIEAKEKNSGPPS